VRKGGKREVRTKKKGKAIGEMGSECVGMSEGRQMDTLADK